MTGPDAPVPGLLTVAPDPAHESGPFRWPSERPPVTPTGGAAQLPPLPPPARWERWGQRAIATGGIALAGWIYFMPLPDGLGTDARGALAVFVLSTALWISNSLPYGVTGLLALALLGLSGAMKPLEAYSAFGSPAIFFLIGIFVIGGALVETGLSRRCALLFLRRFESSPYGFVNGMMLAAAFGTLWMPNQATTAMLFPIALEVALALQLRPKESPYARHLFFSMAWGAMIGSNASFLGSSRAALALGVLQRNFTTGISFTQWVIAAAPVVVLGLLTTPLVLRLTIPRETVQFAEARRVLERSVAALGPVQRRHYLTLAILIATVAAWVFVGGRRVDLAVIALLGAAALFAVRVVRWEQVERHVFWNIILMYGGAIALGAALERSGATAWIVTRALGNVQPSPFMAVAGSALVALVLSEFMSNAAALAVILPLAFTIGTHVGAPPVALTLATSLGAGLDFIFPMSTAPNTIIFSSGYLRTTDFVKAGLLMTLASACILLVVMRFWWPMLGLL